MDASQAVMTSILTIIVYAILLAGVFKIFQAVTELGEIKELLRDIKRNTEDVTQPPQQRQAGLPGDHEALLRALANETYSPPPPSYSTEPRQ